MKAIEMKSGRTTLAEGARVMTKEHGVVLIVAIDNDGVEVVDAIGSLDRMAWDEISTACEIVTGEPAAMVEALQPIWDALDEKTREETLNKLEIVLEIKTGFREGHPTLRRDGEPRFPYGPTFGMSINQRCTRMAQELTEACRSDPTLQRRVEDGELQSSSISATTVRGWVRAYHRGGLCALIDGRKVRPSRRWEVIDPRYRDVATKMFDALDGDRSTVANREIHRRTLLELKQTGAQNVVVPQRATSQFLASLKRERGKTTRAQLSRKLRSVSGTQSYPAIRPGQIVAIDATRADNLVYDPLSGRAYSVEVLTAIDIATRVVLALRVVPRSANGIEAGLLLYDVLRPFSMAIKGTSISPWRWAGIPGQLDLSNLTVRADRRLIVPDFSTLDGDHLIPSLRPEAIRCDWGSIFVSRLFRELLQSLGIDLLLNRGGKANDNAFVERWFETIQRGLQQIPGYKGRSVAERGRLVAEEPLLTARELQEHLRHYIGTDYHRTPHTGLLLSANDTERRARLCPLEMFDSMLEFTGRIDVPQSPDLIYQFLPIRWGTIGHDGVRFFNMTYSNPAVLGPYRNVPVGFFRPQDRAAPFHVDPQDLSRIWFRDRESGRVEELKWRGADRTDAPMSVAIVGHACALIRNRGGNHVLKRDSATKLILDQLGEITSASKRPAMRRKLAAAAMRVDQATIDHGEAQRAQDVITPRSTSRPQPAQSLRQPWPNYLDED
jgi:transposase InsO family protein